MMTSRDGPIRVLYIEGFTPGPGLPDPLLSEIEEFEVITTRMPYSFFDIIVNPYTCLGVLTIPLWFWVGIWTSDIVAWWAALIVLLLWARFLICVKRMAVGHLLDDCVESYSRVLSQERIDVVIGYSWGGGIACALLNSKVWAGPTLLLSPAGEEMWDHAMRWPPALSKDKIDPNARVLTVQGSNDLVVPLKHVKKMYRNVDPAKCQLIISEGENHMLEHTVTIDSLRRWCKNLLSPEITDYDQQEANQA